MGIVIQRIETNGRVYKDGRLKAGDRIVEMNQQSLIGIDFIRAQEILRDALKQSNEELNGELNLKLVRNTQLDIKSLSIADQHHSNGNAQTNGSDYFLEKALSNKDDRLLVNNNIIHGETELTLSDYYNNPDNFPNIDNDQDDDDDDDDNNNINENNNENIGEYNERPIEIEFQNTNTNSSENKENNNINEKNTDDTDHKCGDNEAYFNTNTNNATSLSSYSSVNMSALNTKKLGKKLTVQLIKGPQGLGFKLAARDNYSSGEYSPIYIKNILPKGAAITDGRLQRGDRLLKVNKMDMTQKTLHEAVNILRDTKLGSCVELVVSRQIIPTQATTSTSAVSTTTNGISNSLINHDAKELNVGIAAAKLPREMPLEEALIEVNDSNNQLKQQGADVENNNSNKTRNNEGLDEVMNTSNMRANRRQLLTFEIALNDTGSAGLGVSVI